MLPFGAPEGLIIFLNELPFFLRNEVSMFLHHRISFKLYTTPEAASILLLSIW